MNEMQYYKSNIEYWDYKELGEVVSFKGGSQPPKKYFSNVYLKDYIRLIQIRDYKTEKYKTYIPVELARRFCDKNDIMIGRYGPPIFQILRGLEGSYNVALIKIIPNEDEVDKEYLYYFIKNEHLFRLIDRLSQRTSGQTGVDMEALKKYIIPLPTLKEQQKISSILSSIDEKIEITDNLIEKTKELKKGLMQRLLTKGIGHDRFKDTEIGRIPEEWEVRKLGEICDFKQGFQIPRGEQLTEQKDGYIRYLYITDFFSDKNTLYIKDDEKYYYIKNKDITIANTGNTCGKAFRGASGVLSNNLFKIFNNTNILDTDYMWQYLQSTFYWEELKKYFNTAGQPHVGHKNMSALRIALPSDINEQEKISEILLQVDVEIEQCELKKEKLQELKKGLMQKLLTGKIRVKV